MLFLSVPVSVRVPVSVSVSVSLRSVLTVIIFTGECSLRLESLLSGALCAVKQSLCVLLFLSTIRVPYLVFVCGEAD